MRDCEKALIAALMHEPSALAEVDDLVQPDSFTAFEHQALYLGLRTTSSFDALVAWLPARGLLARVGGPAALEALRNVVPGPANVRRWAELVRNPGNS